MKQKDILVIVMVVIVAGIFSMVLTNLLFASPKDRQTQVEVVDKISAEFKDPDKRYLNSESINPTQTIQIGDNPNSTPFNQNQ